MHKKAHADKKTGARNQTKLAKRAAPRSVSELLARQPKLSQLSEIAALQRSWADWVCARLDPELSGHVVSVVAGAGELVVFADSPAWCTRMRYALAALETQIRARDPSLRRARARVQLRP